MLALPKGHHDGMLRANQLYCMCRDQDDPHPNGCWRVMPTGDASGVCSFCKRVCKGSWYRMHHNIGGQRVINGDRFVVGLNGNYVRREHLERFKRKTPVQFKH